MTDNPDFKGYTEGVYFLSDGFLCKSLYDGNEFTIYKYDDYEMCDAMGRYFRLYKDAHGSVSRSIDCGTYSNAISFYQMYFEKFLKYKKNSEVLTTLEMKKETHLDKISSTLSKLVENVSFSVGSEEYVKAKSDFENNKVD